MPVYIALLHGINLGPQKRMKTEKQVASCATLGIKIHELAGECK